MSVEIEAKMRLTDLEGVTSRLETLGAQRGAHMHEVNTFFDTSTHELKTTDRGLRIRVLTREDAEPIVVITHKGPRAHGKLKSRDEHEVIVHDARAAAALLGALGYFPVLSFEKKRQRWTLDGCVVDLDTLPHLGDFIEIEGPSDEAVLGVRRKLGLEDAPLIRASYIAMLATYLTENHLHMDHIRFDESAPATATSPTS